MLSKPYQLAFLCLLFRQIKKLIIAAIKATISVNKGRNSLAIDLVAFFETKPWSGITLGHFKYPYFLCVFGISSKHFLEIVLALDQLRSINFTRITFNMMKMPLTLSPSGILFFTILYPFIK